MTYERQGKIKIVLIGDERAGKTTLRKQYMGQTQTVTYMATIGADFAKKDTKTVKKQADGTEKDIIVETLIWDLAGQEAYKIVRESFYDGARGALLVLDLSRMKTFENAKNWINELRQNIGSVPFLILGNKSDLRSKEETISKEETKLQIDKIQEYVQSEQIQYLETSALYGENVNLAFELLLQIILEKI